jgi:hypothetical protein
LDLSSDTLNLVATMIGEVLKGRVGPLRQAGFGFRIWAWAEPETRGCYCWQWDDSAEFVGIRVDCR